MMIGGLREFIRGDISRQGLASRLEAVLEPPDKIINIGTRGENGIFETVFLSAQLHLHMLPWLLIKQMTYKGGQRE